MVSVVVVVVVVVVVDVVVDVVVVVVVVVVLMLLLLLLLLLVRPQLGPNRAMTMHYERCLFSVPVGIHKTQRFVSVRPGRVFPSCGLVLLRWQNQTAVKGYRTPRRRLRSLRQYRQRNTIDTRVRSLGSGCQQDGYKVIPSEGDSSLTLTPTCNLTRGQTHRQIRHST